MRRKSKVASAALAVPAATGARHSVHVLESAQFRTLYLHASVTPPDWSGCRVLHVSALLRELVQALDAPALPRPREQLLCSLVLEELRHADPQALGVPLPAPGGDKRLRALCEAVLRAPGQRGSLAEWAADVGASERTLARLFRAELRTGYQQWRQQAVARPWKWRGGWPMAALNMALKALSLA